MSFINKTTSGIASPWEAEQAFNHGETENTEDTEKGLRHSSGSRASKDEKSDQLAVIRKNPCHPECSAGSFLLKLAAECIEGWRRSKSVGRRARI